ncbi:MAG TPA: hypothetical protein VIF62_36200 [Labilithrix sp.]
MRQSLSLRRCLSIAALLACAASASPALAAVSPAAATPVQREQAQGRFLRGKELFGQKKFDSALVEFQASLDIVTSPNARLYVGRCLRETNHLVAAYVELGRTAVEAKELSREDPRYERTAQAASDERAALAPKLGFLEIDVSHASDATTLKVGTDEVRRGGWSEPIPVLPGSADVVLETPGHAPVTRTVTLAPGEKKQLAIDAAADAPEPASKPPEVTADTSTGTSKQTLRTLAYVAGGVGVVGFVTFAIFGLKSSSTFSDLEKACPNNRCPPGHDDDISSGKTQQTVANVGLVLGIVGAGAGVTLFLLSRDDKKPDAPTTGVALGPSWIGLKGAFR